MEEAFEEGQGPHRAVEPVMMMMTMVMCGENTVPVCNLKTTSVNRAFHEARAHTGL
jgi:hypothetical protein